MSDEPDVNDSICGLRFVEGPDGRRILQQQRTDGNWYPVDEVIEAKHTAFTERFRHTIFKPTDAKPKTHGALRAKGVPLASSAEIAHDDFSKQAIESFMRLHALLIKILGGEPEDILEADECIQIKNSALFEVIRDLIRIAGEPWDAVQDLVVLKD